MCFFFPVALRRIVWIIDPCGPAFSGVTSPERAMSSTKAKVSLSPSPLGQCHQLKRGSPSCLPLEGHRAPGKRHSAPFSARWGRQAHTGGSDEVSPTDTILCRNRRTRPMGTPHQSASQPASPQGEAKWRQRVVVGYSALKLTTLPFRGRWPSRRFYRRCEVGRDRFPLISLN